LTPPYPCCANSSCPKRALRGAVGFDGAYQSERLHMCRIGKAKIGTWTTNRAPTNLTSRNLARRRRRRFATGWTSASTSFDRRRCATPTLSRPHIVAAAHTSVRSYGERAFSALQRSISILAKAECSGTSWRHGLRPSRRKTISSNSWLSERRKAACSD
jgi:hypothetical protein